MWRRGKHGTERVNQQTDIELTNDGIKTVAFFLKQQTDNALANKHIIMVTRFCSNPPKKPKKNQTDNALTNNDIKIVTQFLQQ